MKKMTGKLETLGTEFIDKQINGKQGKVAGDKLNGAAPVNGAYGGQTNGTTESTLAPNGYQQPPLTHQGSYNQQAPIIPQSGYNQQAPYNPQAPHTPQPPLNHQGSYNQPGAYSQQPPMNHQGSYNQQAPYNQQVPHDQQGGFNQHAPYNHQQSLPNGQHLSNGQLPQNDRSPSPYGGSQPAHQSHPEGHMGQNQMGHHQPINQVPQFDPTGRPLVPPGWLAQYDDNSKAWYYVEQSTGKSQWDPPPQAAAHAPLSTPSVGQTGYGGTSPNSVALH